MNKIIDFLSKADNVQNLFVIIAILLAAGAAWVSLLKFYFDVRDLFGDLRGRFFSGKGFKVKRTILKAIAKNDQTQIIKLRTLRVYKDLNSLDLDPSPALVDENDQGYLTISDHYSIPGVVRETHTYRLKVDFRDDEAPKAREDYTYVTSKVLKRTMQDLWGEPGIVAEKPVGSESLTVSLCKELSRHLGKLLVVGDSRLELSVADILYAAGFARKGIPAVAFTLPNDERVIEQVGSRQVILKNVLDAKFHKVAWPILNGVLSTVLEDKEKARKDFLTHTLFHEVSHSIGPQLIKVGGESTTVNRSLREYYSVLEEAKADSLGACFILGIYSEADQQAFLALFVAGFLRSIRFGLTHAHGGANAIQFNYLLQKGGFHVDPESGEMFINEGRARDAILNLASEIIDIQEHGDYERAKQFFSSFCVTTPVINRLLHKLRKLPIDIRIRYKTAQGGN